MSGKPIAQSIASLVLLTACSSAINADTEDALGASGVQPSYPSKFIETRVMRFESETSNRIVYNKPNIPALRYTGDGRLGLQLGGGETIHLLKPEKLEAPFEESAPGSEVLLDPDTPESDGSAPTGLENKYLAHFSEPSNALTDAGGTELEFVRVAGTVLCDPTYLEGVSEGQNPTRCNNRVGEDCYDLSLISVLRLRQKDCSDCPDVVTLGSVPLHVEVRRAKTARAKLSQVEIPEAAEVSINTDLLALGLPNMMEPNVVGDGRLFVARLAYHTLAWEDASGTPRVSDEANMIYAVYDSEHPICDVQRWNVLYPISHAPYDTVNGMPSRFGFAHYPFRDGIGRIIPDGADVFGSYPWMDQKANNLFFTAINRTFYNVVQDTIQSRYPDLSDTKPSTEEEFENIQKENSRTMGVTALGLWTRGKMVLLDGLLNNLDYTLRFYERDAFRKVDIYADYPGDDEFIWIGAGREKGFGGKPDEVSTPHGYWGNGSHIDSIESRFNANPWMRPSSPRDVVWKVSNSRATEEVAFDHWLDPHVIVSSEMVGALELRPFERSELDLRRAGRQIKAREDAGLAGYIKAQYLSYKDGWYFSDFRFREKVPAEVLVQNGATTLPSIAHVPPYGVPVPLGTDQVRIEPIAMGGVHGKGLWLTGETGVLYELPAGGPELSEDAWYVGVFIDRRSTTPQQIATLFEVAPAPGSSAKRVRIGLHGGKALVLLRETNTGAFKETRVTNLADRGLTLTKGSWNHLGFVIKKIGSHFEIHLYHNGYAVGRWRRLSSGLPFGPGSKITLGAPQTGGDSYESANEEAYLPTHTLRGFEGWVDDFRVMMRAPTLEELCNEARGTLIQPAEGSEWALVADRYPSFAHSEVRAQTRLDSEETAVCYTQNNEPRPASLHRLPMGAVSLRDDFLFPNDQLTFGEPRPDSSSTEFCLACHVDSDDAPASLRVEALIPSLRRDDSGLFRPMQWDKRQPSQPPHLVWGVMRDSIATFGGDETPWAIEDPDRHLIDELLHPAP